MRRIILACLVLLVIALAACTAKTESGGTPREISGGNTAPPGVTTSGASSAEPSVNEVDLVIAHTDYQPSRIEVSKGDKVRIRAVSSKGTSTHNHGITIDEYAINRAVTTDDKANPEVIEFTADKAGEFGIYCKTCWDGPFGKNHPPIEATLVVK